VQLRFPTPLAPGALLAVVAPSSPAPREELLRGLAWLRTRYRLRLSSSILSRHGYLAGDDERRAAELAAAMVDPEVGAIVCARGGYGAMRIVDRLPWNAFVASPKWIVGFSDVTALHTLATARGIASVHAPNVTGLGRAITAAERATLLDALERPTRAETWDGLSALVPGDVEGPVVGGNLALLQAMAAGGRLSLPPGAILVLEDVTERPYRIDRLLTSLVLGGHLSRIGALVFGDFTECEPGPDGVTVLDVLRDRTHALGVPVATGAPFGHGSPNRAFVLGRRARLSSSRLTFC